MIALRFCFFRRGYDNHRFGTAENLFGVKESTYGNSTPSNAARNSRIKTGIFSFFLQPIDLPGRWKEISRMLSKTAHVLSLRLANYARLTRDSNWHHRNRQKALQKCPFLLYQLSTTQKNVPFEYEVQIMQDWCGILIRTIDFYGRGKIE